MNKDKASGLGIGFLVGAAVGLAIGFLFAPRPGKETRQIIKDKAKEVVEKVKEKAAGLRGKGAEKEVAGE